VANPEAGQRFEEYVRVALARSRHVHTVAELLRAAKLHQNTLYDLFNGTTNEPGPRTIASLATALEVPRAELWAAWEGRELEPDSVEEALRRHTMAMNRQNELLGELVDFIRSSALAILTAGGDAEQIRSALVAIDAAREDQPGGRGDSQPSGPDASAPPRIPDAGTQPRSLRPQPDR
jgi:transcriptional regulator with XRE-family HTH domain